MECNLSIFFALQRVIAALSEHAKVVVEPSTPRAVSVTTHKTNYDTSAVWKKIFAQTFPQRLVFVASVS